MPILRPEVSKLLEASNLNKDGADRKKDTKEMLNDAGLGLEDTLNNLRQLRDFTENESTKVRINESVLKMHGVMVNEGSTIPVINIIISDPAAPVKNPILLPRELHKKETVQ